MYKFIIISLLLFSGITSISQGQNSINFSGGLNVSNAFLKNIDSEKPEGRLGYFIGVAPNFGINEKIQINLDIQFSQRGYNTYDEQLDLKVQHKFSYIDINPELEYKILNYLSLGAGVNIGVKMIESSKIGNEEWFTSKNRDLGFAKSVDFGLTGKIKYSYKKFFAFTRYNLGIANINNIQYTDGSGQIISGTAVKNRNLQIGIGYTINFKIYTLRFKKG